MKLFSRCFPRMSRQKDYEVKEGNHTETSEEMLPKPSMHYKARGEKYACNDAVARFPLKDEHVPWSVDYDEYRPVEYTLKHIIEQKPVWADPDVTDKEAFSKILFNQIDGNINRCSFHGIYDIADGLPRNPVGRTGVCARGQLGKWGPNHAADPIVTRWKRDIDGNIVKDKDKQRQILEFVAIQRRDTKEWAIPGGMVDSGEQVSLTLKREFGEEAMNTLEEGERESTKKLIEELFKHGFEVYKGYVDDPRNTDNAWMETIAVNFHDDDGTTVGKIPLLAGDDAQAVKWLPIDGSLKLYASHSEFIKITCERLNAFFAD